MSFNPTLEETKREAKRFIDSNIHDGEDRSGCANDWHKFSPDDLQELIDDLLGHLRDGNYI